MARKLKILFKAAGHIKILYHFRTTLYMKNTIIITIALIFCTNLCATAQKNIGYDFIINLSNDTLIGTIKEKNKFSVLFTPQNADIAKEYNVNQLIGYTIDNVPRVIATINNGSKMINYFVKVRIKGYFSLYELTKSDTTFLFIINQLSNEEFIPLPNNGQSWGIIRSKFLACETLSFENAISQKNYSYSLPYFLKVIQLYNQCVKPDIKAVTFKSPINFTYGISTGYAFNNWEYTFDNGKNVYFNANGSLSSMNRVVMGVFFNLLSEKKFSYNMELIYNQYKGDRTVPITNNGAKVGDYRVTVNEQYLSIPLQGKYVISMPKKMNIYVKAGILLNYDYQLNLYRETVGITINNEDFIRRKSFGLGYSVGFGLERNILRNKKIFSEIRYLFHAVQDGVTHIGNTDSFQLAFGFGFVKK